MPKVVQRMFFVLCHLFVMCRKFLIHIHYSASFTSNLCVKLPHRPYDGVIKNNQNGRDHVLFKWSAKGLESDQIILILLNFCRENVNSWMYDVGWLGWHPPSRCRRLHKMVFPLWSSCARPYFISALFYFNFIYDRFVANWRKGSKLPWGTSAVDDCRILPIGKEQLPHRTSLC